MDDAYLIRDAIVGNPTAAEKAAAVAALGALLARLKVCEEADLAEARDVLRTTRQHLAMIHGCQHPVGEASPHD